MNAVHTGNPPARRFNARLVLLIACLFGVFTLLAATMAEARGGRGGGGMRAGGAGRMGYSSVGSANRAAMRTSRNLDSGNRSQARNRADTKPATRPGDVGSGDRVNNSLPGTGDRFGNGSINSGNINIDVDPGYGKLRHPLAAGLVVGAMVGAAVGAGAYYGYGYGYGYYGACGYYNYDCFYSLPAECPMVYTEDVPHINCGGTYYQQQMQGDTVVYVLVEPSA